MMTLWRLRSYEAQLALPILVWSTLFQGRSLVVAVAIRCDAFINARLMGFYRRTFVTRQNNINEYDNSTPRQFCDLPSRSYLLHYDDRLRSKLLEGSSLWTTLPHRVIIPHSSSTHLRTPSIACLRTFPHGLISAGSLPVLFQGWVFL